MRPPPYFQNIQTRDVVASQLHSAALNIAESEWDMARETAGRDEVRLDELTSLKLSTSECQSAAVKHWRWTSRNVAMNSALTSRQKQLANIYSKCSPLPTAIDTARIVYRAGSMKRLGVRRPLVCPPVCPSMGPRRQTRCCRFAAAGPAGRRCRLLHASGARV